MNGGLQAALHNTLLPAKFRNYTKHYTTSGIAKALLTSSANKSTMFGLELWPPAGWRRAIRRNKARRQIQPRMVQL